MHLPCFIFRYCETSRHMTFKKQQKATEKTVLPFELSTAAFRPSSKSWCIEILKRWEEILLLGPTWKRWKRRLLAGTSASFCCCRFFCSLGKQIVESRFLQKYIVPNKRAPVAEGGFLFLLFFFPLYGSLPSCCFLSRLVAYHHVSRQIAVLWMPAGGQWETCLPPGELCDMGMTPGQDAGAGCSRELSGDCGWLAAPHPAERQQLLLSSCPEEPPPCAEARCVFCPCEGLALARSWPCVRWFLLSLEWCAHASPPFPLLHFEDYIAHCWSIML